MNKIYFKTTCVHYTFASGYEYCDLVEGSIEKIGCNRCPNYIDAFEPEDIFDRPAFDDEWSEY